MSNVLNPMYFAGIIPTAEQRRQAIEAENARIYAAWRERECQRLGITPDEHQQIIDLARRIGCIYPERDTYTELTHAIMLDRIDADFDKLARQRHQPRYPNRKGQGRA